MHSGRRSPSFLASSGWGKGPRKSQASLSGLAGSHRRAARREEGGVLVREDEVLGPRTGRSEETHMVAPNIDMTGKREGAHRHPRLREVSLLQIMIPADKD